jgi:hypothetical protein
MPNFDAGRYFLTVLAPIRDGAEADGVSHRHALRLALATLPTALQSPATEQIGLNSPFARNRRNHLARFAVLDDLIFNGAMPIDPILGRLTGRDPIDPGPVDKLGTAFLLFTAEIDAVTEDGAPLPASLTPAEQDAVRDSYAATLWATMEPELHRIFHHCHGFDGVESATGFAHYLARCQVETTMPFNDYYTTPVALPKLPLRALAAVVLVPLAVLALAALGWLAGAETVPLVSLLADWHPGAAVPWALLATGAALFGAYRFIMARGQRPLPPAADATLPDVLKALYLQRQFTQFAVAHQGLEPTTLHAAFGGFLDRHRPQAPEPTQPPGGITVPVEG